MRGAFSAGAVREYRVGKRGGVQVDAEMYASCENPIEIYRVGTATKSLGLAGVVGVRASADRYRRAVSLRVRCRNCTSCLAARGTYWRKAAEREMMFTAMAGCRTWFGTLTLSPEHQAEAAYAAMSRAGVENWHGLTPAQQMPLRHEAVSRSLTLALKRLRAECGKGLRYLIVCEAHKSMLPHYHMLLHEARPDTPVRKSSLDGFWRLGFSQWRLAKPHACRYIAKYLSKAAIARVRASQLYGSEVHETALPLVSDEGGNTMPPFFSSDGVAATPALQAMEKEVYQHGAA